MQDNVGLDLNELENIFQEFNDFDLNEYAST